MPRPKPGPGIGALIIIILATLTSILWLYRHTHPRIDLSQYQRVPIASTSLAGGVEGLGPGQWLEIDGRSRAVAGTDVPDWLVTGRIYDTGGDATAKSVVYLDVLPEQVPTLQAALIVKDGQPLFYKLRPQPALTPTGTLTETPTTPSPTATSTPFINFATPRPGQTWLEIPISLSATGSAIDPSSELVMVIVAKQTVDGEGRPLATPSYLSAPVSFHTFLDDKRVMTSDPASAESVIVALDTAALPGAAAALTHAERVYLIPASPTP